MVSHLSNLRAWAVSCAAAYVIHKRLQMPAVNLGALPSVVNTMKLISYALLATNFMIKLYEPTSQCRLSVSEVKEDKAANHHAVSNLLEPANSKELAAPVFRVESGCVTPAQNYVKIDVFGTQTDYD